MNKSTIKSGTLLNDIRFWIFIMFLIRLIGITNPPLEIGHNWRQTTVTMVARNFMEIDANILYPRIDIAGDKTGITGMEFPLLNYLIYLVSLIFGYDHWYGRLINLIFSSFGIFYFYKLINKYFTKKIAFNASLILLFSIWFSFSRKIMPDTFSMSLVIIGMYYGSNYFDNKNNFRNLALYGIFALLGVLSKLPSGYLLILFLPFIFSDRFQFRKKVIFSIFSIVIFGIVYYWYFIWVPYLVEEYQFWHFYMGESIWVGLKDIRENISDVLTNFYENAIKYIAFFFFSYGLIEAIRKNKKRIVIIFSLSFIAFLIVVFKAGATFAKHDYYIIPFVPVMALISGYGLSLIKNKKLVLVLLVSIGIEGVLNQKSDFIIKEKNRSLLALEDDLNQFSDKSDLILINSGNYPTPMYFAHHKGWVTSNEKLANRKYINNLRSKGLKHIVVLKRTFGQEIELPYNKVFNNKNYDIYSLNQIESE